jgi:hypothetical protein
MGPINLLGYTLMDVILITVKFYAGREVHLLGYFRHFEVLSPRHFQIYCLLKYILYNKLKLYFLYFNIVFELSESVYDLFNCD